MHRCIAGVLRHRRRIVRILLSVLHILQAEVEGRQHVLEAVQTGLPTPQVRPDFAQKIHGSAEFARGSLYLGRVAGGQGSPEIGDGLKEIRASRTTRPEENLVPWDIGGH